MTIIFLCKALPCVILSKTKNLESGAPRTSHPTKQGRFLSSGWYLPLLVPCALCLKKRVSRPQHSRNE